MSVYWFADQSACLSVCMTPVYVYIHVTATCNDGSNHAVVNFDTQLYPVLFAWQEYTQGHRRFLHTSNHICFAVGLLSRCMQHCNKIPRSVVTTMSHNIVLFHTTAVSCH